MIVAQSNSLFSEDDVNYYNELVNAYKKLLLLPKAKKTPKLDDETTKIKYDNYKKVFSNKPGQLKLKITDVGKSQDDVNVKSLDLKSYYEQIQCQKK